MELYDNKPLASVAVANDDVAQQSHLCPQIEERYSMGNGIVANVVTYLVMQVVHQPTLLDGQDLVESTGDVEADGRHVLLRGKRCVLRLRLWQGSDFFLCKISLIRTAIIEFVAILLRLHAAEDGSEVGEGDLSDTRQLVEDLLLLELQLLFIGQVLPLTTATDAEVLTKGYRAYLTIFYKAHHLALGKGVLLTTDLNVADVARDTERHKDDQLVPMEKTLAFSGHSLYHNTLKEW